MTESLYTRKKTPDGNYEVFKGGDRVSTGTDEFTKNFIEQNTPKPVPVVSPIQASGIRRHVTSSPSQAQSFSQEASNFFQRGGTSGLDVDEQGIRDEERARVQGEIDAIESLYASLRADEVVRGEGRVGRGRSIISRSGLMGSDFGEQSRSTIENKNKQNLELLEREKLAKIQAVISKADDRAATAISEERNAALKDSENYLEFLKGQRDDARQDLKDLAKGGVSLADLQDEEYTKLLEQSEYTPMVFEAIYNANSPEGEKKDYSYFNLGSGKVVRFDKAGGDPEEFEFDIPQDFEFRMAGDIPVFVNPETQEIKVAGGEEGQEVINETELDTFTNANGSRVSVMYNPVTRKTRQVVHGKAKGDGGTDDFFKPSTAEKSAVARYIQENGDEKDLERSKTDTGFFYSLLTKAQEDGYYKPSVIGLPVDIGSVQTRVAQ